MPPQAPERLYAPGIRLYSMALALLKAGVPVRVLEIGFLPQSAGAQGKVHEIELAPEARPGDALPPTVMRSRPLESDALEQLVADGLGHENFRAIVATTDRLCAAAALAAGDLPLWCDFNGHPMAERQGLSRRYASDEGLAPQWDDILPALLRADRFSTCSRPQALALVGELGACGRLNRHTDGLDLVAPMPVAYARSTEPRPHESPLRGIVAPPDAFVALWAGGYNTWADAETLAQGLRSAMDRNPDLYFVSTGGAIEGHDDRTYEEFRRRMADSPYSGRCRFAGWVDTAALPDYYALADVALMCDRPTLEGRLGSRNRVLDWACAALPVLTTDICELTHEFARRDLIDVFAPGDAAALAQRLTEAAEAGRDALNDKALRARAYALSAHAPERVYGSLVAWAARPERAPDVAPPSAAKMRGAPFFLPNNTLSRRRAQEWLHTRKGRDSLWRRLGRVRGRR